MTDRLNDRVNEMNGYWDYLPLGRTHQLYHGLMLAIALMVLWKVRKL